MEKSNKIEDFIRFYRKQNLLHIFSRNELEKTNQFDTIECKEMEKTTHETQDLVEKTKELFE